LILRVALLDVTSSESWLIKLAGVGLVSPGSAFLLRLVVRAVAGYSWLMQSAPMRKAACFLALVPLVWQRPMDESLIAIALFWNVSEMSLLFSSSSLFYIDDGPSVDPGLLYEA
jgi:hypothetical protein